jgi:hypothetical protein
MSRGFFRSFFRGCGEGPFWSSSNRYSSTILASVDRLRRQVFPFCSHGEAVRFRFSSLAHGYRSSAAALLLMTRLVIRSLNGVLGFDTLRTQPADAMELLAIAGGLGSGWREMWKRGGDGDQGPLTMDRADAGQTIGGWHT